MAATAVTQDEPVREASKAVQGAKAQAQAVEGRWVRLRRRYHWLDHVVIAYQQFNRRNGDFYAAGITYFSFLAIFPIIFLAVSVSSFIIGSSGHLHDELFNSITTNVPGGFGNTLKTAINSAVERRTSVGIIGIIGVLLSGLGWISNIRKAVNAVCNAEDRKRNFALAKLSDLFALAGLGLSVLFSLGVTVGGTAFAHVLAKSLHIQNLQGASFAFAAIGIALAVLGDVLLLTIVFARFPNIRLPRRSLIKGAVLGAVGLEFLKLIGTAYIAKIASSPTYGVLGSIIGVLIWIDLVCRFLLFSMAWTATEAPPVLSGAQIVNALAGSRGKPDKTPEQLLVREMRKSWKKR